MRRHGCAKTHVDLVDKSDAAGHIQVQVFGGQLDSRLLIQLPRRALGKGFTLLGIDADVPESLEEGGIAARRLALSVADDATGGLAARYLGDAPSAVYLIRPDQHVAARWDRYDEPALRAALRKACGKE